MAKTTTQLAVFLKNVPGALHELLRSLAEKEINIEGMMATAQAVHMRYFNPGFICRPSLVVVSARACSRRNGIRVISSPRWS